MHNICRKNAQICKKYVFNMQGICIKYAYISTNMHKYVKICIIYAKNMQKICKKYAQISDTVTGNHHHASATQTLSLRPSLAGCSIGIHCNISLSLHFLSGSVGKTTAIAHRHAAASHGTGRLGLAKLPRDHHASDKIRPGLRL